MLGRLAPQVIGTELDVFDHQRVDIVLVGPLQPIPVRNLELHVHHAVDQRRRHGPHDGAVLRAVARANDDGAFRQGKFADAPVSVPLPPRQAPSESDHHRVSICCGVKVLPMLWITGIMVATKGMLSTTDESTAETHKMT